MTRKLEAKYETDDRVQVIYLQTTFDLEQYNTWSEGLEEAQDWDVKGPVAQDKQSDDNSPITMAAYRSTGTPWTVVIDQEDNVRYSGVTPEYRFLEALVAAIVDAP